MRKKKFNIQICQTISFFVISLNELTEEPVVYLYEIELKKARDTVPLKRLCQETNNFFEGLL